MEMIHHNTDDRQMVDALVATIELRDAYTKGHSKRVAHLATQLGVSLGLDQNELHDIYFAGLMHDLGKIGIPDAVLLKPERLNGAEYAMIQQHSTLSGVIIERMDAWRHLVPLVRHHHERMDGTGYPDGLSGEAIPLGARIITIADIYDALTSSRVYRDGVSHSVAVEQMREMALNGHIDPVISDIFFHHIEGYSIPEDPNAIHLPNLEMARNIFFYKDPLTSLFNRNALLVFIKKGIAKHFRLSLIKFDIKGFKEINSRFGLSHGDKILVHIGMLLDRYAISHETLKIREDEIVAFRTTADCFFLLYLGEAVDYFEYKCSVLLNKIAVETGVDIKDQTIFHHYYADNVNTLEWGYLL